MAKPTQKALDLGAMQDQAINAAKAHKAAQAALLKATKAAEAAEAAYIVAQKTLASAFESVRQATKVL